MPTKRFQRRKESFTCDMCGTFVEGTGYTDHCPNCLTSKHVDINPGDRRETCHGLMEPIAYSPKKDRIYYRCTRCNNISRVKSTSKDNTQLLTELSSLPVQY